jgi:hypothetical protein
MDYSNKEDILRILHNNKPLEEQEGLSLNELNTLVWDTYSEDSPLQLKRPVSDELLNKMPFFLLSEAFLKILSREKGFKLTGLGYLPQKLVKELYELRHITDDMIEAGITKMFSEENYPAAYMVHSNCRMAGLVRKSNGKLRLTQQGERMMAPAKREELFYNLFKTYTDDLQWGAIDGYSPMPGGNMGWGFGILLLLKYGEAPNNKSFYAEKYITEFPCFLELFPQRMYSNPYRDILNCFDVRFFDRFAEWWGFVSIERPVQADSQEHLIIILPVVRQLFEVVV